MQVLTAYFGLLGDDPERKKAPHREVEGLE
jgi:hypothetical protein